MKLITCTVPQAAGRWLRSVEFQAQSQGSPHGIFGRWSSSGMDSGPNTSFLLCYYHFTSAQYIPSSAVNSILWATDNPAKLNTKQKKQLPSHMMLCIVCTVLYVYAFMLHLMVLSATQIL
jgi:hypothetical protein